jgi:hypothetical protein
MIEYYGLEYQDDCAGQLLGDKEPPIAPKCPKCGGELLQDDYGGWWCFEQKCHQTHPINPYPPNDYLMHTTLSFG